MKLSYLLPLNTDVSMKAIQILNTVYFGQGEDFLETCLRSLRTAAKELHSARDEILVRIQRALLLLKTYLETFRRKYAYHFRRLSIDGHSVGTHAELAESRIVGGAGVVGVGIGHIRVSIQGGAGGPGDRVTLEMRAIDLVADLRAEVAAWWEAKRQQQKGGGEGESIGGPLRLLTQGQELSTDMDEKALGELGFKDQQLVLVSQGASKQIGGGGQHFRGNQVVEQCALCGWLQIRFPSVFLSRTPRLLFLVLSGCR